MIQFSTAFSTTWKQHFRSHLTYFQHFPNAIYSSCDLLAFSLNFTLFKKLRNSRKTFAVICMKSENMKKCTWFTFSDTNILCVWNSLLMMKQSRSLFGLFCKNFSFGRKNINISGKVYFHFLWAFLFNVQQLVVETRVMRHSLI